MSASSRRVTGFLSGLYMPANSSGENCGSIPGFAEASILVIFTGYFLRDVFLRFVTRLRGFIWVHYPYVIMITQLYAQKYMQSVPRGTHLTFARPPGPPAAPAGQYSPDGRGPGAASFQPAHPRCYVPRRANPPNAYLQSTEVEDERSLETPVPRDVDLACRRTGQAGAASGKIQRW